MRMVSSMVSASEATRCVRLSSPVSGSCRDSRISCSSRARRSLLMRTTPCARAACRRRPANQQPVSSIQTTRRGGRGPRRRIRSGRQPPRRSAPATIGRARPTGSSALGSISLANSVALASASGGISVKTAPALSLQAMVSAVTSQTKAACPSEARMLEACGTGASVASIWDTTGVILTA